MSKKKIELSAFRSVRSQFNHAVHLLKSGYFAVQAHCTFDYWIMSDSFDCELVVKTSIFNKLIEFGVVQRKDNRYYYSDDAPILEFKK